MRLEVLHLISEELGLRCLEEQTDLFYDLAPLLCALDALTNSYEQGPKLLDGNGRELLVVDSSGEEAKDVRVACQESLSLGA